MDFSQSLNNKNSSPNSRLSFKAEYYQAEAGIIRLFLIYFSPPDQALEIYEQKSKKTFLRRTRMPELSLRDFFIGSSICVFGRQFDITDYGDEVTKNSLAKFRTRTFMLIKPSLVEKIGVILTYLMEGDVRIDDCIMIKFCPESARIFLSEAGKADGDKAGLMNDILMGPCIGIVAIADNIMRKLKACHERANNPLYTESHPSLRKLFEEEEFRKGIYCSSTEDEVNNDIEFIFNPKSGLKIPPICHNTTLAIVKPHIIKEAKLGHIMTEIINKGYKIRVLRMLLLERVNCEEFYEVYRGILPEYIPMVAELASGVCVAMEIGSDDSSVDVYVDFREFCGPMDPEVAKLLRPNSLRAKLGTNKVKNAIHCTDLREDTILEIHYLFKILSDS